MDMNGIEAVELNMLGSADTVTVGDLTGTDLARVDVNLAATGGDWRRRGRHGHRRRHAGRRRVTLDGATAAALIVGGLAANVKVTGGEPAHRHVDVDTLGGDDSVTAGAGVSGPASIDVDGGADSDTVTFNGTTGDDTIGVANNGTAVATFTPNGELVDSATRREPRRPRPPAATTRSSARTASRRSPSLTIDGGAGNDTLDGGDGDDMICSAAPATTTIDGNRGADTEFGGGGDDTFQLGPGRRQRRRSRARAATTRWSSTAPTPARRSTSRPTARGVRLFRDVAAITQDFDGIETADVNTLGSAPTR